MVNLLAAALIATASGTEAPADSIADRTLGELSVTAIKDGGASATRPVALTSVSSAEAERLGIVTMKGVSDVAPNFYVPDYGSRMTSSIYVRGIGARIDQPSVGLTVDNVTYLNKDNYDFDLVDIERIEVMRGPQSTLYGRNTMAGAVSITTLSPRRWQGIRLLAEGGMGGTARASAGFYERINNCAAMSLTADFHYRHGFFKNHYSGARADGEEGGSLRWKTSWSPLSSVSVENTASLTLSRQHGYPYEWIETGQIAYNDTCFYRRTGLTDGLTVRWSGGNISIASITSLQLIDDNMTLDQDFLPESYFTLTQKRREWAGTQDVVVNGSTSGGAYSWLAGAFAFYKRARMEAPVTFKDDGIARLIEQKRNEMNPTYPISWNSREFPLESYFTMPTAGAALYHRSTLEFGNGAWTAAADVRLDIEHVSLNYRSVCSATYDVLNLSDPANPGIYSTVALDIDNPGHLKQTFAQLLPKLTLTRRLRSLPESIIYLSIAKGYKSGGYNNQMFSDVLQQQVMESMGVTSRYDVADIVSYRPEKSWNYELGANLCSANRNISGSIAMFWIECRDQQLTMFPDGLTTGRIMANAGRTRSYGVELSGKWRIIPSLLLNGAWGYTNAHFSEFFNGLTNYAGKRVPYAPANTLFAALTWTHRFIRGALIDRIETNINLRGTGNIYWDEANLRRQPFYARLGASVRLERGIWSVDFWGENLTNTRYTTFSYTSISDIFLQRGLPVNAGVTLRVNITKSAL